MINVFKQRFSSICAITNLNCSDGRYLFLHCRQFVASDNRLRNPADIIYRQCLSNTSTTTTACLATTTTKTTSRNRQFAFITSSSGSSSRSGSSFHLSIFADISYYNGRIHHNYFNIYRSSCSSSSAVQVLVSGGFFQNISEKLTSLFTKRILSNKSSKTTTNKMMQAPTIKLNNGHEMPILGLGTYASVQNEGESAIKHAIDLGYRHIDTAYFYQNESEVGLSVKSKIDEGVVTRDEMFVVTKLWNNFHSPDKVEHACRLSLKNLGLDYIDLYLMHTPVGYKYVDDETLMPRDESGKLLLTDVDYLDTWSAMEKLVEKGLVRSIGISNFNSEQIDRLLLQCTIKPVTNQVECNPDINQKQLIKFCKERDITVTAYCPLARPNASLNKPKFIFSDKTKMLAEKYNKTPAQIVLRYLLDIGTIPIPKSVNNDRIKENFDIFGFKLNQEDIASMDTFNSGERLVPLSLIKAQNHKYFPFSIEY